MAEVRRVVCGPSLETHFFALRRNPAQDEVSRVEAQRSWRLIDVFSTKPTPAYPRINARIYPRINARATTAMAYRFPGNNLKTI
jgi:hypothetical protein